MGSVVGIRVWLPNEYAELPFLSRPGPNRSMSRHGETQMTRTWSDRALGGVARKPVTCRAALLGALALALPMHATRAQSSPLDSLAAQVDSFVAKPRLLVLTDIANEPDDQMSLVRLLVYSNRVDLEGLVASTSTWMKRAVRPE